MTAFKLEGLSESLRRLVKTQIAGPQPRVSDSTGLGCGLPICISNKLPGEVDVAGLGMTLRTTGLAGFP